MTSSPRSDHEVAVVRQPIADARRNVVGYELLFGGQAAGAAGGADATSSLLLDAFGDIGIDQLVGAHPAWLAIAPEFVVEVGQPPLRPDRAVLQLPSAPPGDEVLAVLQQLARTGYTLALDHFDGAHGLSELLALCSIVKIDVADRDEDLVRALASFAAAFGGHLTAVGVDSDEDFQRCEALGFTYFQGSFLAKPRTVRQRGVATAGVGSLRALPTLASGTASFEELEGVIGADVGLSLKLLRYVNSAYFSLPRTVKSIREALQMLGARTVARWATVMALSSMPDVRSELLELALHRARMCETLGGGDSAAEREAYFTVGLFSVAHALMGQPMEDVLADLPFDEEIRAALLRREGPKGELLAALLAYERGEFPELPSRHAAEGKSLAAAYREALDWAASARTAAA